MDIFSYLSTQMYVVGTYKKWLIRLMTSDSSGVLCVLHASPKFAYLHQFTTYKALILELTTYKISETESLFLPYKKSSDLTVFS